MRKCNCLKVAALLAAAALMMAGCGNAGGQAAAAAKTDAAAPAGGSESAQETAGAAKAAKTTGYPTKPIDLVVPFAAGGNVDLSCRILAAELEKELGQPVNVLNKEGGGAVVGQTYAVNQKPDGYTMLALTSSYVTNVLSGATTYDMESITPIAEYCFDPELLVASEASGIKTFDQFMEVGKTKTLLNSTPGFSTSHHIASLLFTQKTGIRFEFMHTNGSAEQTVQLAGGHAEVGFTTYAGAASLIDQGKIKVLAICADKRSDLLPDVPTMKESGVDFVYGAYRGLAVPAGTPDDVVQALSDAMAKAMVSDEVKTQFANSGFPITYADAASFKAFLADDYTKMEAIQDLIKE